MTEKATAIAKTPLFLSAAESIRKNIDTGALAPGTVLLEGPLADLLEVSRAPIKRALALLEQQGVVSRFDGRGYLVGGQNESHAPVRTDLKALGLLVPQGRSGTRHRSNWQRLYGKVEADVSMCLVFGQYRVVENDLAAYFGVSRTVIRDILSRLQERGLVTKTETSRWLVGPLTARAIKDKFELCIILEVAALRSAAGLINKSALQALCREMEPVTDRLEEIAPGHWFAMVNQFADLAVLSTPNKDLWALISANRKMLQASQKALFNLGLSGDASSIIEIRMISELLIVGATDSAAEMMENHLVKARNRTIAQLKIVAVVPQPSNLAPYLISA